MLSNVKSRTDCTQFIVNGLWMVGAHMDRKRDNDAARVKWQPLESTIQNMLHKTLQRAFNKQNDSHAKTSGTSEMNISFSG